MNKSNGNYYMLAVLGVIICGLPSVFTNLLNMDLPTWVTIVALIIGLGLLATGAFLGIKARKKQKVK